MILDSMNNYKNKAIKILITYNPTVPFLDIENSNNFIFQGKLI